MKYKMGGLDKYIALIISLLFLMLLDNKNKIDIKQTICDSTYVNKKIWIRVHLTDASLSEIIKSFGSSFTIFLLLSSIKDVICLNYAIYFMCKYI